MKVRCREAVYAVMYGAGNRKILKMFKENNKRLPARVVKKSYQKLIMLWRPK